jgi:glutathione S-transferase
MPLDLYYTIASPPCRSVMLLAKTLGLELNLKHVDVLKKKHLEPEFLKVREKLCKRVYYFDS